jgi:signal transduction histidine kinase/purine-cytosine permease-like protein/CheY-like chemotaxis protein
VIKEKIDANHAPEMNDNNGIGDSQRPIFSARRNYNRWVSNQTLEDYALRFTSKKARRFSFKRVTNTALGCISFLALEAIGGMITLNFGFYNSFLAILVVGLIIFLTSFPISYYATRYGVDIDLLSRGASFGYIGSTITSLVYALFTFIFFAIEAAIMASVLEMLLNIPIRWGYLISAVVIIPLVTHGIAFISRFQLITQPIWVALQLAPFIFILCYHPHSIQDWGNYQHPEHNNSFNILLFGAAASVVFSLIAQVAEQVDFLRFLPPKTSKNSKAWWLSLIASGPGWIIIGVIKILAGSFLFVLALQYGLSDTQAINPVYMYSIAYSYITSSPQITFSLLGIFIILSQLKINVTNAYAGSIAWSNFFSRLTHYHPGRVVWLVFNVLIALLLMQMNIFNALETILQIYSIVAVAWIGSLVADLVINKPLNLSPKHIEFRRGYLYSINPVGIGSMTLAASIGLACYLGVAGPTLKALAPFVALVITFIASPFIAYLTKGKYYLARNAPEEKSKQQEVTCLVCENEYEVDDIVACPVAGGNICSLCCSLNGHCYDKCKSPEPTEKPSLLRNFCLFPFQIKNKKLQRVVYFTMFISSMALIMLTILWLVKLNTINIEPLSAQLDVILLEIFAFMMVVVVVLGCLFVLTNESRNLALNESLYHTELLREEMIAHNATTIQLQLSKEHAEAANLAKNRYLSGISHELRTPLNSLLGYSQLLEKDKRLLDEQKQRIIFIRKSGEYLADLIEGLVDISSIEAGKLVIQKDTVPIQQLLFELAQMFNIKANAKGLKFDYQPCESLPDMVIADEKHLKQILINLLSNAIKYTNEGWVKFKVSYSAHVANFTVEDSGIGIAEENMKRIFEPFERIYSNEHPIVSGTGLGLTITQLLIDIMGGNLVVESQPTQGSSFKVQLFMAPDYQQKPALASINKIIGYHQTVQHIVIVDDNKDHRLFIEQMLSPLGFKVSKFENAQQCLANKAPADLYLIDIFMPLINGWELVGELRGRGISTPIIMVSANAIAIRKSEHHHLNDNNKTHLINDYIVKPVRYETLLSKIARCINLTWQYDKSLLLEEVDHQVGQHPHQVYKNKNDQLAGSLPSPISIDNDLITPAVNKPNKLKNQHILKHKHVLIEMAEIGYVKGIRQTLAKIAQETEKDDEFLQLEKMLNTFQFQQIVHLLRGS